MYGANTEPKELRLGDRATREWRYDAATHSVVFTVPNAAHNWTAQLMF